MKTLCSTIFMVSFVAIAALTPQYLVAQNNQSVLNTLDDIQSKVDQIPPAWSQLLQPANRFLLVMNGAAVLDKETGLVWEQSPGDTNNSGTVDESDRLNWIDGVSHCAKKTVGNRKGWRLPTVQELASLVDTVNTNPSLPSGHPFTNVQSLVYWTASSGYNGEPPWSIVFSNGTVTHGALTGTGTTFVWCVRGGQGVDPQ
jgi:Protein of unknown function (DUF1566)